MANWIFLLALCALSYSALTETSTVPCENATGSTDLCSDGEIDTIFSAPDGNTYVFKDDNYYRLNVDGIACGYPRSIVTDWVGLPDNIDAAFTWKNSQTYFFKGSNYWRFTNFTRDYGYPKPIAQGFPGVPDDIDSAFAWSNDKAYLFKGILYWRFDLSEWSQPIESTDYPKVITVEWRGLPSNLDAVFKHSNDTTYFFKDGKYWQYDDQSDRVAEGNPAYPRPVGPWWFRC